MAINFRKPPSAADSALSKGLDRIAKSEMVSAVKPHTYAFTLPPQQQLPPPHPVYSLGLEDLINNKPLNTAESEGWRYFVRTGGPQVSWAEVRSSSDAGHKFSQLDLGPYVGSTLAALQSLEKDLRLRDASYEVRLLRVPALYFISLWLKEGGLRPDIFVPVAPSPKGVEAGKFYSEKELRLILMDLAQDKLEKQKELESGSTASS